MMRELVLDSPTGQLDQILEIVCVELQLTDTQYDAAERSYTAVGEWLGASDGRLAVASPEVFAAGLDGPALAALLGMGVIALRAETKRFELRPRYRKAPGLDRIRKALGSELFAALFRLTRRWSPPKGIESMEFADERTGRAAFAKMEKLGIVKVVHTVRMAELGEKTEDDEWTLE